MKVLIVGCLGMLGSDLMTRFGSCHQVRGVDQQEMDITRPEQFLEQIQDFRPDVVINAAALTKVDYCETNQREAFLVNGEGAGNLAKAAACCGALMVHYSTDYIFDGLKAGAYLEEDAPNPPSIYGKSKLLGEQLVRHHCADHLILRTSWLFGRNGPNFIRTIVDLAQKGTPLRVVNDQRGSPSYSEDVASHTLRMVEAGCRSTYHVTNSGSCTWYELALHALECMGLKDIPVTPVATRDFPRPAPRPANSILADSQLERNGVPPLRPWQGAVREYLERHLLKKHAPG